MIFCFFAEDTDIFNGTDLFTTTIGQMSARDSSNTHEVIGEVFRAINTKAEEREAAKVPRWAAACPYVNGGLFSGRMDVPEFSRIARSYLLHVDWPRHRRQVRDRDQRTSVISEACGIGFERARDQSAISTAKTSVNCEGYFPDIQKLDESTSAVSGLMSLPGSPAETQKTVRVIRT